MVVIQHNCGLKSIIPHTQQGPKYNSVYTYTIHHHGYRVAEHAHIMQLHSMYW